MSTVEIAFKGWFMCRLATDPDPTDEPRGVSGSTFALAYEPDLDRVIYLQNPPPGTQRSHGPVVGVETTEVRIGGQEAPWGAGAQVNLLGGPKFENRNFVLTMAGAEPIIPFDLRISWGYFELGRSVVVRPASPDLPFTKIPREELERYGARGFYTATEKVLSATGITDPLENRSERRDQLLADLDTEREPLVRSAIEKRIRELDKAIEDPKDERMVAMRAIEEFSFDLNGPVHTAGALPLKLELDLDSAWPIEFWMGGWDADALSGYMVGALRIPTKTSDRRGS